MSSEWVRRVSLSEVDYAPGRWMPPHSHPAASIGFVIRGSFEEDVGGAVIESRALSVVAKPAGFVHEDRFGERGARMLSLRLPRRGRAWVRAYGLFHGGQVGRCALDVLRAERDGGEGRVDTVVRLLRTLAAVEHPPPPPPWVASARVALDDGASVSEVAGRLRVHPGSLTRAYRRAFGVTPVEDRVRRRVWIAADQLVTSNAELVSVAGAAGFADQAHFTRVFKRETGMTPAAFRAVARG